ncbi:hypothetical protein [Rhodanobacter aciditrophus]|uniref:hypothetical protein n=1 Tax=Rhodanobacter aciditrophus TaxID=1623218 RepID=UPI003CF985F3
MNTVAQDAAFAASYALNRHIPAMANGFTIDTDYGSLTITAEEARKHPELRHVVESIMQFRLYQAERLGWREIHLGDPGIAVVQHLHVDASHASTVCAVCAQTYRCPASLALSGECQAEADA